MKIWDEFREFMEWRKQRKLESEAYRSVNDRLPNTPTNKQEPSRVTTARTRRVRRTYRNHQK